MRVARVLEDAETGLGSSFVGLLDRFIGAGFRRGRPETFYAGFVYKSAAGGSTINAGVPDEALVGLVLQGNSGAFEPLVERHKRGIVNFLYGCVRSAEDANDLAQETFIRAYAHLRTFNPQLAKFSTWLYQIARNTARTHIGKDRRRPQIEELYEDETLEQRLPDTRREAAPEAMILAEDEQKAVRGALAAVPERMRMALALRYYRHMEYQEIADAMGVSLGNVKTLIHRGKAALARTLGRTRDFEAIATHQTPEVGGHEVLCL